MAKADEMVCNTCGQRYPNTPKGEQQAIKHAKEKHGRKHQ
jgi:hypothetical protein